MNSRNKKFPKIFITGAHLGGNKGAEAMLEVLLDELITKSKINEVYDIYVERLANISHDYYSKFSQRYNNLICYFTFNPKNIFKPYSCVLSSNDIMIDIGGISYTSSSSFKDNLRNFIRHSFFIFGRSRTILFTQDYGPVNGLKLIFPRLIMSRCNYIFVRSNTSYKNLMELKCKLNIKGIFPDFTIKLKPTRETNFATPYFVVVPSAILFNRHGVKYLKLLEEFIKVIPKKYSVIIMSHNFSKNGETSDVEICSVLHNQVKVFRDVELVDNPYTADVFKGILSDASGIITSRYHAAVAGLTSGVPVLTIGWNSKYYELMKLYGINQFAISPEQAFDFADGINIYAEYQLKKLIEAKIDFDSINERIMQEVECSFQLLKEILLRPQTEVFDCNAI